MKPIFDMKGAVGEDSDPSLVWESTVHQALPAHVSDIHLLARRDGTEIVYRIDGDMWSQGLIGPELARRVISHVKSISGMDLAESRRPTEGRLLLEAGGRSVDLRVSVVPTLYGQDLVARVFDRRMSLLGLPDLGFLPEQLNYVNDMLTRPHGLILVCGPTGSGKTTSLYAMLQNLTGGVRKIMTIEDPIEYELDGVSQSQVNARIGLGFDSLLKAVLRQDADVIMVGEVRDEETAATALRAANAGKLVLATTHATRASRAVESMLGLGVHPYWLAVALRGVMAQVLVKRVCPQCKQALPETADMIVDDDIRARLRQRNIARPQLHRGTGCDHCWGSGYRGRLGLFELFVPSEEITQLITGRRPAAEIDRAAAKAHLLSLEQSGKIAALEGLTTMEEIVANVPMA